MSAWAHGLRSSFLLLFLPHGGSAMVLLERKGAVYRAFDAGTGALREVSEPKLQGEAYFFFQGEPPVAIQAGWAFRVLSRLRPLVGHALFAALVFGLVMLPAPLFVMAVYGYVMPSGSLLNLAVLSVGATVAILVGGFFVVHRARILSYIAGRIDFLFGTAVFKQILALPASMSENAALGGQIARLSSFESIRDVFTGPLISTLLEAPALLAFVIALGVINPAGLLAVGVTLLLYMGLYWLWGDAVDRQVAESSRRSTRRHEFLVESISKLRAIREFGGELTWMNRFREISSAATMVSRTSPQRT